MMDQLYSGEDDDPNNANSDPNSFEERLIHGSGGGGGGGQSEEILETEQRLYTFHQAIAKLKESMKSSSTAQIKKDDVEMKDSSAV